MPKKKTKPSSWALLQQEVVDCRQCNRLIEHCQEVAQKKRRAYQDQAYWGRPVPNLGPRRFPARKGTPLLVIGLAPGAHGANRTGRMFTGDRSGEWLYRALHKAGFANQSESTRLRDGLQLSRCAVTNVCRCAPPGNKPTPDEISNCQPFLKRTIQLCKPVVFLALGGLAWKAVVRYAEAEGWIARPQPKFGHGNHVSLGTGRFLLGSYHPSQQNTFTGKLSERMFDDVFSIANQLIDRIETCRSRSTSSEDEKH